MANDAAFADRDELWGSLTAGAGRTWDVIVIGGGITGAGIVREAARRGYCSLLIEQRDFCWGTSSRSSKMVHGGLRYLASGKLRLTRDALRERERLLQEAPGLVERLRYYFPLYRGHFPPRVAAAALFWLYDRLAGVDDRRYVDTPGLRRLFPDLDTSGLNGAYRYSDAVTDDARLVLRLLHEAAEDGAAVRNYTRATELIRAGARVNGLAVQDRETDRSCKLAAGVVINATGAWADRLDARVPENFGIRPQRGSHLVLDSRRFPAPAAIFLRQPEDGRRVFVYPWEGRTIVGTTDIQHGEDLDSAASITAGELDYLLRAARPLYSSRPPGREDVIATWSGVRPIIGAGPSSDPSRASREHQVWSEPGLVSCSGGKLTTFLHMARDVMARAAAFLPPARSAPEKRVIRRVSVAPEDIVGAEPRQAQRLLDRYGDAAAELAAAAGPGELDVVEGSGTCLAELRWSSRCEAVVHLDDLLLRRSRLGLLLPQGGDAVVGRVKPLVQEVLGWDDATWRGELQRYRNIISRHYSLPCPTVSAPEQ
jgi:glycerol-3-phosphate dehydrogenase